MANDFPRFTPNNTSIQRSGNIGVDASASGPVVSSDLSVGWWSQEQAKLFSKWSSSFDAYSEGYNNPYFDYFYTGQDIQVTIDGLSDSSDILPIYSFGYTIQQQKMPIYGFWNYTYSAMLRGTRIVTGAFTVVSLYPNMMTDKIAKAASVRAKVVSQQTSGSMYDIPGLDQDSSLIDKYWSRHYDTNLDREQQHVFSIHPPFNFVIKYGLQEASVYPQNPIGAAAWTRYKYDADESMMSDYNERLLPSPSGPSTKKILLENIEIVSKSVEYNVDGDPLTETYTFMARDERLVSPEASAPSAPMARTSSGLNPNSTTTNNNNNTKQVNPALINYGSNSGGKSTAR